MAAAQSSTDSKQILDGSQTRNASHFGFLLQWKPLYKICFARVTKAFMVIFSRVNKYDLRIWFLLTMTDQDLKRNIILKKGLQILYYVSVVISALVGLWHFFVPWMFQWYDYLPTPYRNPIVGIDYTNYCFSLLLFGLSVMLILLGKRALAMNREVIYFYFFLTVVWIFRACLASFIEPWPLQPIPAAAIGQLIASDVLAVMMIVVSVSFVRELRRKT